MTIAQNQIISIARLILRTALYLSVLYLLFLLGRDGYNRITSLSIPFGLSPATSFVISSLFILLFCCFGLLVIIHFFKSSGNE